MNERSYGELRKFLQLVDKAGTLLRVTGMIGYLLPQVDRMYFVPSKFNTFDGVLKVIMNYGVSYVIECSRDEITIGIEGITCYFLTGVDNLEYVITTLRKYFPNYDCGREPNSSISLVDDKEKYLKRISKLNRKDCSEISSILLCYSIMNFPNFSITDISKMVPSYNLVFRITLSYPKTVTLYVDDDQNLLYYSKKDRKFPYSFVIIKNPSDCLEALNKFFLKE